MTTILTEPAIAFAEAEASYKLVDPTYRTVRERFEEINRRIAAGEMTVNEYRDETGRGTLDGPDGECLMPKEFRISPFLCGTC